jgi:hypothetical protein
MYLNYFVFQQLGRRRQDKFQDSGHTTAERDWKYIALQAAAKAVWKLAYVRLNQLYMFNSGIS